MIRKEDQGYEGGWGLAFIRGWLKLADLRQSPLDTPQKAVCSVLCAGVNAIKGE